MESVFGFTGEGFSVVVSDASVGRSILVYKQDQDKVIELDDSKIMGIAGAQATAGGWKHVLLCALWLTLPLVALGFVAWLWLVAGGLVLGQV